MPISTRRYTELRLAVSTCMQTRNWKQLFEVCGTGDDETKRALSAIFTIAQPAGVWKFLEYVAGLGPEERRQRRDSVATCCYIIGKMGQTNTKKALSMLRLFLSEDHMLRLPVQSALSNLWVLDYRNTAPIVLKAWAANRDDNDDLEEIGIRSVEYMASEDPKRALPFLLKVTSLSEKQHRIAARTARELIEKYVPVSQLPVRIKKELALRVEKKR